VVSAAENSNKFQKTRFWKEKSVEDVVTLECLPVNSSRRNCVESLSLKIYKVNTNFLIIFLDINLSSN
jgi:hypothetical protein